MNATWFNSPLRAQLVQLRLAAGLSLRAAAALAQVGTGSLGAYERGDRRPPADVLEQIFTRAYRRDLVAVPSGTPASLTVVAVDAAGELRQIAARLDRPQAVAA